VKGKRTALTSSAVMIGITLAAAATVGVVGIGLGPLGPVGFLAAWAIVDDADDDCCGFDVALLDKARTITRSRRTTPRGNDN
jgi:hypothetical protein